MSLQELPGDVSTFPTFIDRSGFDHDILAIDDISIGPCIDASARLEIRCGFHRLPRQQPANRERDDKADDDYRRSTQREQAQRRDNDDTHHSCRHLGDGAAGSSGMRELPVHHERNLFVSARRACSSCQNVA